MEEQSGNPNKGPGKSSVRKQKRKRQKLLVQELMTDYAQNSTLHGLRYMTEKGRTIVEKIFWVVVFLVSIGLCAYLIGNVYDKWKNSPVIVAFNDFIVPVGTVPFPSLTVCPQIKSDARIFNYTKEYLKYKSYYMNGSTEDTENFTKVEDLMTVCEFEEIADSNINITDFTLVDNILSVFFNLSDVIDYCKWRNNVIPCEDVFDRVLTSEGFCYTFNVLAADDIFRENSTQKNFKYLESSKRQKLWSLENGYENQQYIDTAYPRSGRENTADPDLIVVLREKKNTKDLICNVLEKGFKIFLNHPADQPQGSLHYYGAATDLITRLALKFNMISTSKSLENYSPDVRNCYFPNERPLRYFKIYTDNNCRLECQTNYTLKTCGCVWFHMPHNDSKQICTMNKAPCMAHALEKMVTEELNANIGLQVDDACNCLPPCHSISYDAEVHAIELNVKGAYEVEELKYNIFTEESQDKYSRVEFYFKEPRFVSVKRSELFGVTDFMANCGGLLGLFLGFSFLSLVEIVYFASIRLYYILKKDQRDKSSRAIEMTSNSS